MMRKIVTIFLPVVGWINANTFVQNIVNVPILGHLEEVKINYCCPIKDDSDKY